MSEYQEFLESKAQLGGQFGFAPIWMPRFLYPFQQYLVNWALQKGKAAIFADCGLGKTPMQLVWAQNIVEKTNRPVLVITPLAVGPQTIREGQKFGIEARRAISGAIWQGINVINYQRLHQLDSSDFAGVVLDESSILKSFDGATKTAITEFMRARPYRLLCTATAAPNDYIELGTSSEALGELGYTDMLTRFFKNDQNTIKPMRKGLGHNSKSAAISVEKGTNSDKWRFKGHARVPWMQWVCSWARAVRKPSDLGFDDGDFVLPKFHEKQHLVTALTLADGMLFALPAEGLKEQREERTRTIRERCERVAELVQPHDSSLIWCHLDKEADMLERTIPGAVQISGKHTDEKKEELFAAFISGDIKRLVTKPKIGAWGLNFQHCNHIASFPSHSFEQYYQGVRRCWRFGQKLEVYSDIVTTEGEQVVMENFKRKSDNADKLFTGLVEQINHAQNIDRFNQHSTEQECPDWLF